jgi:H+/Cl- antiporter ClcA
MTTETPGENVERRRRLWRRNRRLRRFAAASLWRRRLVFSGGALAIGLVSVGLAQAADWGQKVFAGLTGQWPWVPLIATPLGFVLFVALARRFFPGSEGSGIPQAIAALEGPADLRKNLLAPRMIFGKIALTIAGLMVGASSGREGPTVQVGAAIMLLSGRIGRIHNERNLILAGSAAGLAAAFNTPLAGVVFAIEELGRSFEQRANGVVFYAVIISGVVSLALLGDYTYFGVNTEVLTGWRDWALAALCGSAGGLAGGVYARLHLDLARRFSAWTQSGAGAGQVARNVELIALACGLFVALLGVATGGATFGSGYDIARRAVEGQEPAFWYWPAKLLATVATSVSGIPGGIFAPSLSAGAGFGGWLATAFGADRVGVFAVMGMTGYFAGVVQAPLTAFVIVLEMTGAHQGATQIMLAAILGYGASRLVARQALYHGLAEGFLPRP